MNKLQKEEEEEVTTTRYLSIFVDHKLAKYSIYYVLINTHSHVTYSQLILICEYVVSVHTEIKGIYAVLCLITQLEIE